MFKKGDKAATSQATAEPLPSSRDAAPSVQRRRSASSAHESPRSVISAGLKVVGNLESDDDLQVFGSVDGDIAGRTLTVAEGATVNGIVRAETVMISGSISGEVAASSVTVARSGQVTGDLHYHWLAVEKGAVVDGRCVRLDGRSGQNG
ncbi:MAG: bactofilin family protein [Inquilinaceae bacterium]